jgi:hypothetical protein
MRTIAIFALLIFSIILVRYALNFRSANDFNLLSKSFKSINSFYNFELMQGLEYFQRSSLILEISNMLYENKYDASDKNLTHIVLPLPFDRFVPNSVNLQWVRETPPMLNESNIVGSVELVKAIENDDRPIGHLIKRSTNWDEISKKNYLVAYELNNILHNQNLSDPIITKNLHLDDATLALANNFSEFITKAFVNERILQQAYPGLVNYEWLLASDILSWQVLLSEINNASNEVTFLINKILLSFGYKLQSSDSKLNKSDRELILYVLNYLIHGDSLIIDKSSKLITSSEIKKIIKKKWYGKDLVVVNREILQYAIPNAIRPRTVNLSSRLVHSYSPYYPSIPMRADLGELTIINVEPFFGSVAVKNEVWFRPAYKFYKNLSLSDGAKIFFSTDLENAKEINLMVESNFRDELNFEGLAPNSTVLSDETWLVTSIFHEGWNKQSPINKDYWYGSVIKGTYGSIFMKFPILPVTYAKWIGRNQQLKDSKDIYYRKEVSLKNSIKGDLIISGINRYELFINGVLIGRGEHWNVPGKYTVTLNDGDVIGVHLSVNDALNDALLLDFQGQGISQWTKSPIITGYRGNKIYLKLKLSEQEFIKVKSTRQIELNELKKYQINNRKFYYYISPLENPIKDIQN